MKQYIKDNKIYNAPIKIKNGDETIISSDAEFLKQYGYEVYIPQPVKITLEEMIEESNKIINEQTDNRILNDFVWNDNEFYLTMENQQNFANLFIAKDMLEFPQTVKTKTGYAEIKDIGELSGFYLAGVNFIKKCLEIGWAKKQEAEEEIRKNYK
jgi:hypothetical protein